MLSELRLPSFLDTSTSDLIADFFVPALQQSVQYDRGVGYFSSGWLRIAATGMVAFAENGGRARWVTSPILGTDDWEALRAGDAARTDAILYSRLQISLNDMSKALTRDTLSALAWMVADEILDFRLAVPRAKLDQGDFHDKFGVFTDISGQQVSFNGSYNDSIQGTRNYESIKLFSSWEPAFAPLVVSDSERFERLWLNIDPNVQVYRLPDAARMQILQLRDPKRPYKKPPSFDPDSTDDMNAFPVTLTPHTPDQIVLHDYQDLAIEAWFKADCRGLLEMATGTGKTITALAASARLFERERRLAVVITVPYKHLVEQWRQEAADFGYRPVLAYESKARWHNKWLDHLNDYRSGYRDFISVIVTHDTFGSSAFQETLARLNHPCLLIADEAHHLGAEHSRQSYPANINYRLALSATPTRWFDEIGTAALNDYFGGTVYSLPLSEVIGKSLTPYYYYPHLVSLNTEETDQYRELSVKIARMFNIDEPKAKENVKTLLMKRAVLLNSVSGKLPKLEELINENPGMKHALFYCAPGQIDEVQRLLGYEKEMIIARFTQHESSEERERILTDFASGRLQALVAIKCLDEGVDVPATQTAYLLASSGNPREFVQRRGRVLRRSPGKEFAIIHDLIAVPMDGYEADGDTMNFERSIMRHELSRFREFADTALNKHKASECIWEIAKRYSLLDF